MQCIGGHWTGDGVASGHLWAPDLKIQHDGEGDECWAWSRGPRFRDEIKVLVMNGSDQPYVINPGELHRWSSRRSIRVSSRPSRTWEESYRASGGFGSTGVRSLRLTGGGGSPSARGERGRSQEPPTSGVRLRSRERSRTRTFPRERSPEEVNVTYHDDGSTSTQRVTGEKVYFRAPAMRTTSVRRPGDGGS